MTVGRHITLPLSGIGFRMRASEFRPSMSFSLASGLYLSFSLSISMGWSTKQAVEFFYASGAWIRANWQGQMSELFLAFLIPPDLALSPSQLSSGAIACFSFPIRRVKILLVKRGGNKLQKTLNTFFLKLCHH